MEQGHSAAAPLVYAIALGSLVLFALFRSLVQVALELVCPTAVLVWKTRQAHQSTLRLRNWVAKHLVYQSLFPNGSFHSRGWSLIMTLYITASLCCVFIKAADTAEIGVRAGHVALINFLLLFTGPCLHFAADIARFPLRTQKQIHMVAGYTVAIVAAIHTFAFLSRTQSFPVATPSNLFAVLSISAVLLLLLPLSVFARFLPYELLLSVHHILPYVLGYSIWRHLPHKNLLPRLYIYILLGVFSLALLIQIIITLVRCRFRFHTATFSECQGVIQITIRLRNPLPVRPGQYINLWTPSSIGLTFQSHPLTIASWSSNSQEILTLYAQVQKGFTRKLLQQVACGDTTSIAMFTGPHGVTLPLDGYDQVLLIATDLGVVALLPYLRYLAYRSHSVESRTRRVHLVWRLKTWSLTHILARLLNSALEEDERKESTGEGVWSRELESVISISIYGDGHEAVHDTKALKSRRVCLHSRQWNLRAVVEKDTASGYISYGPSQKPSAIAASVSSDIRVELNDIIKTSIQHVDLMYTDYQPEK